MPTSTSLLLKFAQWFVRAVQFGCAAVVLGLTSYYMAAQTSNSLEVPTHERAVEGITGAACVYTLVALLLLCCLAGLAVVSALAVVLDVLFMGAFIYVAWFYRRGAQGCDDLVVNTIFGYGSGDSRVPPAQGADIGFTRLPTYGSACRMEKVNLSLAILAIFFFLFSVVIEVMLVRNRSRVKREEAVANGPKKGGLFSSFRRRGRGHKTDTLPPHTTPDQLRHEHAGRV